MGLDLDLIIGKCNGRKQDWGKSKTLDNRKNYNYNEFKSNNKLTIIIFKKMFQNNFGLTFCNASPLVIIIRLNVS